MRALRIPSFTEAGRSYVVAPRGVTMTLYCECPAFRRDRPCKHVRVYRAVEDVVKRCATAGHLAAAQVGLCPTCVASLLVAAARKHAPKPKRRKKSEPVPEVKP